jgi:hypothetical protein
MQLFCLGLSHHTAAVSLRECFAVPEPETSAVLSALRRSAGLTEAVLLGNIAAFFPGETLTWNAASMSFPEKPEADKFLRRTYRQGWEV